MILKLDCPSIGLAVGSEKDNFADIEIETHADGISSNYVW